jgi:hypothetical protein
VEGHHPAGIPKSELESGNITEPDDNFRVRTEQIEIKEREKTSCSVSAAEADNGMHPLVGDHRVKVRGAIAIVACKKPRHILRMGTDDRWMTFPMKVLNGGIDSSRVMNRASGGNQTNAITGV